MNESKTEESRFWIAYFLEDMPVDTTFSPGVLHLTIIPPFVSDRPDSDVIGSFNDYFAKFPAFEVHFGEMAKLGSRADVLVTLIKLSAELTKLHEAALDWLKQIDARWAVRNPYTGDKFKPHIRRRKRSRLKQESVILDSLALVRAQRTENNIRQVVAKVELV